MRGIKKTDVNNVASNSLSSFGEKERKETEYLSENFRNDLENITAWTSQAMFVSPTQVAKGAMSSGTKKQTIEEIVKYVKEQRKFAKWLESVCNQLGGVKTEE